MGFDFGILSPENTSLEVFHLRRLDLGRQIHGAICVSSPVVMLKFGSLGSISDTTPPTPDDTAWQSMQGIRAFAMIRFARDRWDLPHRSERDILKQFEVTYESYGGVPGFVVHSYRRVCSGGKNLLH
jgi:hypothetical protein